MQSLVRYVTLCVCWGCVGEMTGTYVSQMALPAHGQPLHGPERPTLHALQDRLPIPAQGQPVHAPKEPTLQALEQPINEESLPEESFSEDSFPEESLNKESLPEESFHEVSFPEISFPEISFSEESFPEISFPEISFPEQPLSEEQYFEELLPVPVQGQPLHAPDASALQALDAPLLHTVELPRPVMPSPSRHSSKAMVSLEEAERLNGSAQVVPRNLEGRTIRIALANYPPFLEFTQTEGKGDLQGSGMSWEVMVALADYFNFTVEPVVASDNLVGVKTDDGWKGALELIDNQKAELTLMPVTVTELRKEVVEFSHLLGTTSFGMLVRRPEYTPKPDALLRPFNNEVWLWIVGSMAIMGPLIYFIIVFRVRLCRGDPRLTRIIPFDQCCWFVYGAMMKQGSMLKPISDSSRILFATWWLFIMIVTSFYTANLTAFLTFNGLQLPITDVSDLAKYPDITWLASRDGAVADVIKTHPQLQILRDLQNQGRGRHIESRDEALSLVLTGDYVYIDDMQVLDFLIQQDFKRLQQREDLNQTCSFYTSSLERGSELTYWYGFGFKNGSEYIDLFNGFFRRLSTFGIIDFLRNSATASSPVCTLPKGFKDRALENKDLFTTYILFGIGIAASLLAMVSEFIFRRIMKRTHHLAVGTKKSFLSKRFSSPPIKVMPSLTGPVLGWNNGLPPLPDTRQRTPFEVKYPQYAALKGTKPQYTPQIMGTPQVPVERPSQQRIINGKINDLDVKWDQKEGKLLLRDVKELAGNVAYVDGVPYAFLHYRDKDGPKLQKLILSDLI